MLPLAVFLALFVLAKFDDLLGVNYSFDVDFYTNFNDKKCDNENMWRLVRYERLEIEPPYADSDKAIRAVEGCCASSFPIIFVGGLLEISAYVQAISQNFTLSIEVFDESDSCITSYIHQRSSDGFKSGWQTISLKINKHFKGYIHLRGRSLKNETLLIDSFRYTPNDTISHDSKRSKRSVDGEREDENEIIFKYKTFQHSVQNERLEGSGDDDNETVAPNPPTDRPIIEEPEERDSFWNPVTIALVSFGVIVVVALIAVGAYHFGKVKAVNNTLLSFIDVEPPRPMIIPRINSRSNRSSPLRFYDY